MSRFSAVTSAMHAMVVVKVWFWYVVGRVLVVMMSIKTYGYGYLKLKIFVQVFFSITVLPTITGAPTYHSFTTLAHLFLPLLFSFPDDLCQALRRLEPPRDPPVSPLLDLANCRVDSMSTPHKQYSPVPWGLSSPLTPHPCDSIECIAADSQDSARQRTTALIPHA